VQCECSVSRVDALEAVAQSGTEWHRVAQSGSEWQCAVEEYFRR
jgi:hypothetical protein